MNKSNITLLSGFEFQNSIKKNEKNLYALFSDLLKDDESIPFVNIVKRVIFNETIELFIFFCYFDLSNVFEKRSSNTFFEHDSNDHVIKIISEKIFSMKLIYNLSIIELEVLRKYINENLTKEFIKLFKSSTKFFILFVKKSDDELRLCVNYRDLNVITIKNRYSLFFINESLDKLSKTRIFTKLNVRDVFHKICIKGENEGKTTFKCGFGHYQYKIMFFDLINVSASFQVYINKTLHLFLNVFALVYLDDILIYTTNEREYVDEDDLMKEHVSQVKSILKKLKQFDLYAKFNKCHFYTKEVDFLNFRVSFIDISMQKDQVSIVQDGFMSCSHRNVQTFIDFANFYKQFVDKFSRITASLINLLKDAMNDKFSFKFEMIVDEAKLFRRLKKAFTTILMLRHFSLELKTLLKTDSSRFAISEIISQLFENEKWHSVVYGSRKMTSLELNYDVGEQKLLAIVEVCKQGRHYVKGSKHFIKVIIDHANLCTFMIIKILSRRKTRGGEQLFGLNLEIKHKSSKKNPANKSSRRRDFIIATHTEDKTRNRARKTSSDSRDRVLKTRNGALIFTNDILKNDSKPISSRLNEDSQGSESNHVFVVLEDEKMTDKTSKCSHFLNENTSGSIAFNAQNASIQEVLHSALSTSATNEGLFMTIKQVLRKKDKPSTKTKQRGIDQSVEPKLHRLVNVEEYEDLAFTDLVKKVSSKDSTLTASFLKLRSVLFIFQKTDFFATRVRFQALQNAFVKRNDNDDINVEKKSDRPLKDFSEITTQKGHIIDDFFCGKNKFYIFSDLLRKKFLKQNHDDLFVEHFDYKKIFEGIKRKYFGTDLNKDVKQYVNLCMTCYRVKSIRHKFHDLLNPFFMSKKSRQNWTMDFVTDLSSSLHMSFTSDAILVMIDRYIKLVKYISTKKTGTTKNLIDAIINMMFTQFDRSRSIINDRESLFTFNFGSAFCYHLGMRLDYNTAYHSQIHKQTEKQNQTLEVYLRCYINYEQNDGVKGFNITKFAYNNNVHSVIKRSSFDMTFDFKMSLKNIVQADYKKEILAAHERAVSLTESRQLLEIKGRQLSAKAEENYNKKKTDISFNKGNGVYFNAKNICSIRFFKKLDHKYYDSYIVFESIDKVTYKLEFSPSLSRIHDVFHVFLLESTDKNRDTRTPPIKIDGESK